MPEAVAAGNAAPAEEGGSVSLLTCDIALTILTFFFSVGVASYALLAHFSSSNGRRSNSSLVELRRPSLRKPLATMSQGSQLWHLQHLSSTPTVP